MPRIEGFDEIEEKIRRHPGAIAYYNIIDLQRVFRGIYKENRNQLVQHIVAASSDSISIELIQNVRPSDFKEQYTTELLRRLFNYLSSLSSLVELEMRLSKKYAAHNLMLYNEISVEIIQSGENAFLGNLRNYILHYGIPPLGWSITLSQKGPNDCVYYLSKDKLLKWRGWSEASKSYINRGDINLKNLVSAHGEQIDRCADALIDGLFQANRVIIDEANMLIHERNDILSGVRTSK